MAANDNNSPNNQKSNSLYVGDLPAEMNEAMLYDIFSSVGPVASVRVCRDLVTRKSLRYAYINYHSEADATKAMKTLNNRIYMDHPIRIMWIQRDPATRNPGSANVFVKNLDKTVTNQLLNDTFSKFGTILSSKVAYDNKGQSLGYGFVQFENDSTSTEAIEQLNGQLLNGKNIYVGKFVRQADRVNTVDDNFTNLYIRGFPLEWTKEDVENICSEYGTITSIAMKTDATKNKPFAFVNFESPAGAKRALEEINKKEVPSCADGKLYVSVFQKKAKREQALYQQHISELNERRVKSMGLNLYVKNLDESIDDAMLKKIFSNYGHVLSAKVMVDENGNSKGFGFVSFPTPEEATSAVTALHRKPIRDKPLYVGLAERREQRSHRLQQRYRPPYVSQQFVPNYPNNYQIPNQQVRIPYVYSHQSRQIVGSYNFPNNMNPWGRQSHQHQNRNTGPMHNNDTHKKIKGNKQMENINTFKFTSQARNRTDYMHAQSSSQPKPNSLAINSDAPLTTSALATAQPPMQKQIIGEKLFPLIANLQPKLAGKITGMMLEMDNNELLLLLETENQLRAKVDEAVQVLRNVNRNN